MPLNKCRKCGGVPIVLGKVTENVYQAVCKDCDVKATPAHLDGLARKYWNQENEVPLFTTWKCSACWENSGVDTFIPCEIKIDNGHQVKNPVVPCLGGYETLPEWEKK